MPRTCIMGIDPGKAGAIAILCDDPDTTLTWLLSEIDWWHFEQIVKEYEPSHVYLEKAQSMPKQGVASVFTYGAGFGRLVGWIEACELGFTMIRPQIWTKEIHKGCDGADAKAKSQQAVVRLFPRENLCLGRGKKKHEGLVDALLIAEYGRRVFR